MNVDPVRALQMLESSILFSPDFPRRVRFTPTESLALRQAGEQGKLHEAGAAAMKRARSQVEELRMCVEVLGAAHWEPAVPALVRLWRECALFPVWRAAGAALLEMGTPETMEALMGSLEDPDWTAQGMAIRAVFARGSSAAYDYFDSRFGIGTGEHWILRPLFSFLCHPDGRNPDLNTPLRDRRWLTACARHLRHPVLGRYAREVLRRSEASVRQELLGAAKVPSAPARVRREGNLLRRYEAGEHETVWQEIRAYGSIAGELREEVLEVAECAMRKVARNTELMTQRLREIGWQPLYDELHTLPQAQDAAAFARLAEISDMPLPPTLLAFWRLVGGINWVWDYERPDMPDLGFELPLSQHDALCVHSPDVILPSVQEWREENSQWEPELREPVWIPLAPDYLHKANISGGGPYGVHLPFAGGDPPFQEDERELPFLEYLRMAFRWAGFPGLRRHAQLRGVRDFVERMGRELEPF